MLNGMSVSLCQVQNVQIIIEKYSIYAIKNKKKLNLPSFHLSFTFREKKTKKALNAIEDN